LLEVIISRFLFLIIHIFSKIPQIVLFSLLLHLISKYSSIISSNYIFKGLAFETLGPWCKEAIDLFNVIGNRLIAESDDSKSKKLPFNVETLQAFGALFQIPHYYRKFLYCKTKMLCTHVIKIVYYFKLYFVIV
jgi:hypothetical protein